MATKYKRYSRGGRFKGTDIGDAGISALRQRDAQIVEGIERQRRQHEEISRDQLSGMDRAFRLEADNMAELQALEDKIYQNKRDNIKLRGQREVEALKGKADEYGRQAEHWKELTPKLGKSLQQLSEGFGHVANKLGYEQARKQAAEDGHSTLDMWGVLPEEYEKASALNEKGSDVADALLKKQIEEGNFSKSQELALDSTGVYWKNGRVHYLAKSILGDINQHFDEGMRAYSEMFGPPKTAAEYEKASRWILNTIESTHGLSNSNYNSSVQELRKKFREIAGTNGYAFTKARNTAISETKITESATIFNANPTPNNLHRLIWTTKRFGGQKNEAGMFIPHTDQSAIRQIVSIWAADLNGVSDDELIKRLGFATPKEGQQKGDAGNGYDKSTLAGRDLGLYQFAIDIRAKAKRNKTSALTAAEGVERNKQIKDTFQWALGLGDYAKGGSREKEAFDGSTTAMEERIKQLELIAPQVAKRYKTYLMNLTNSGYNLELMRGHANTLIIGGDYLQALKYIHDNPIFDTDEKRDLLNRIPFVTDLGAMGKSVKTMNKEVEGMLKHALGLNPQSWDPSMHWAKIEARSFIHTRYQHWLSRTDTKEEAYASAMTDFQTELTKGKEGIGIFKQGSRGGTSKYFTGFTDGPKGIEGQEEINENLYGAKELERIFDWPDGAGAVYLVESINRVDADKSVTYEATQGEPLKTIFSKRILKSWTDEFKEKGTFTSNAVINKLARELPRNHPLYQNKAGLIRHFLSKTEPELAKTIPDDTKIVTANFIRGLPNYETFAERIINARSSDEVKSLVTVYSLLATEGSLPTRNNVKTMAETGSNLEGFLKFYGNSKFAKIEVIPTPVKRNKTENITEFRLGSKEATKLLQDTGHHWGLYYDKNTDTFFEE